MADGRPFYDRAARAEQLLSAVNKLGLPTESEYVAAYCRRVGRDRIEHWNYYVAFSLFRLAAQYSRILSACCSVALP